MSRSRRVPRFVASGVRRYPSPGSGTPGISRIRQAATLAETYYVAVAPNHEGGPVGTAIAIHLAASLPNFFIQHVPQPVPKRDRRMRSGVGLAGAWKQSMMASCLPTGSGLGIEINEAALEKYKETRHEAT